MKLLDSVHQRYDQLFWTEGHFFVHLDGVIKPSLTLMRVAADLRGELDLVGIHAGVVGPNTHHQSFPKLTGLALVFS